MDIERLYDELGKALVAERRLSRESEAMSKRHHELFEELQKKMREERENHSRKFNTMHHRVMELEEAINLAENEGMDPLQAKIIAKERIAEKMESGDYLAMKAADMAAYYAPRLPQMDIAKVAKSFSGL